MLLKSRPTMRTERSFVRFSVRLNAREQRQVHFQPMRPFRGRALATDNDCGATRILDLKCGQVSVFGLGDNVFVDRDHAWLAKSGVAASDYDVRKYVEAYAKALELTDAAVLVRRLVQAIDGEQPTNEDAQFFGYPSPIDVVTRGAPQFAVDCCVVSPGQYFSLELYNPSDEPAWCSGRILGVALIDGYPERASLAPAKLPPRTLSKEDADIIGDLEGAWATPGWEEP